MPIQNKKPLIILTGPTAVGKTALSIDLAKAVNGEIVSADSMQVYRYMDIGSAKVTKEEMQGVPHHLVDVLDPKEECNVVRFQQMAKEAMEGIYARGRIPVITGGTGFYIQALLRDIDFTETAEDAGYRAALEQLVKEEGPEALHVRLQQADPEAAEQIHAHNVKRVIRALEYHHLTGQPISAHNETQKQRVSPYQFVYFVLNRERNSLYRRIELRVDQMLEQGLLEEVKRLAQMGYTRDMVSMQGLGYKELLDYLSGDSSYEEAVYRLKRDTRHFAKRQLTWFRREEDVTWVQMDDGRSRAEILKDMLAVCREKGVLQAEADGSTFGDERNL